MKKSIVLLIALFSFAACDLTKLEPAQTKSFMKYFGADGLTYGEDLLILEDGYLLLGNNYATEDRNDHRIAVLIKTDLNGNTLWSQTHQGIEGRSLAQTSDGYFIVGDGINGTDPATMMLIKTNLEGSQIGMATPLGSATASYHGTAITISAANEVVVSGYIETGTGTDSTFLYGYSTSNDLTPTWTQVRKWGTVNTSRISSSSMQEVDGALPGETNFIWTNLANTNGTDYFIEAYEVGRDEETPAEAPPIFEEYNLTDDLGDFRVSSAADAVIVQTAINNAGTGIVFAQVDQSGSKNPVLITPDDGANYTAYSVVRARDGNYVVLGSTDNTGTDQTRTDTDFFIKKVAFDGTDISDGFTLTFGGTAEEYGTKIIQTDDDGYVFIGTHENDNEVDFMVLVKITKDGQLIN